MSEHEVVTANGDDTVAPGGGDPPMSVRKKVLFAVIVVIGPLLVAELLCRLTGAGGLTGHAPQFSDWEELPDGRRFWVFDGEDNNTDGMRDHDHEIAKPEGVHRIICLGDSVTAGHGVPVEHSIPYLFESFLQQMKLPVEVINVSVSGWSTHQEAMAYEMIARKYSPDHVFLFFCLNDVAEMHNNMLEPPPAMLATLSRYSALFRFLVGAKDREVREIRELFDDPAPESVTDGWRRVLDALNRLRESIKRDGVAFSVVVVPFRFQTRSDAPPPVPQERITSWCLEQGVPTIDLLPALRRAGPTAFYDVSHLNRAGAKIVAKELIRWGRTGCIMCAYDLAQVRAPSCPRCGAPIER